MASGSVYLHLSSEDQSNIYQTAHEFEIILPHVLDLTGQWELGLHSISYQAEFLSTVPKMLTVQCNLIDTSVLNGQLNQILRRLPHVETEDFGRYHWTFESPQYINVIVKQTTSVKITLLNEQGLPVKLTPESWVCCTLHIRKVNTLL